MDFKNYVRMMLEAEKAEDQDKEKAEDQDEDEEDDSDENEDDDEAQASVKTKCTGCEASTDTDDEDDSDEDDDEDDSDEDDDEDEKPKAESLRESMIRSSNYLTGSQYSNVLTEETRVLVEGIENNSASKYLAKLSKKAEKEAAKFSKKGAKDAAAQAKKAAASLKEASNKLYRCETKYKAGDVTAKKEYKQICKQYSKELKTMGKGVKGFKTLIFTVLAGSVLLGAIGLTATANNDLIDKLNYGFQNKDKMPSILKGIAVNDKKAIEDILHNLKNAEYEKGVGNDLKNAATNANRAYKSGLDSHDHWAKEDLESAGEKVSKNLSKAKEAVKKGLDSAKAHAGDKYFNKEGKITDWAGEKADWDAQKAGYKDALEQEKYEGWARDKAEKIKETGENISKAAKGTIRGVKKTFSGAAAGAKKGFGK